MNNYQYYLTAREKRDTEAVRKIVAELFNSYGHDVVLSSKLQHKLFKSIRPDFKITELELCTGLMSSKCLVLMSNFIEIIVNLSFDQMVTFMDSISKEYAQELMENN